jgi:hypothetical protein
MSQANRYLGSFCLSQRIFPPQIIQGLLTDPSPLLWGISPQTRLGESLPPRPLYLVSTGDHALSHVAIPCQSESITRGDALTLRKENRDDPRIYSVAVRSPPGCDRCVISVRCSLAFSCRMRHVIPVMSRRMRPSKRGKCMTIQEALHKVEEIGYPLNRARVTTEENGAPSEVLGQETLFDPLFWVAFGWSLGWNEKNSLAYDQWWRQPWHGFIDHVSEGKPLDAFFAHIH